jgi:hypothetical protein
VRQRLTQQVRVDPKLAALVEQVMQAQVDPHTAATRILDDADTVRQWLMPGSSRTGPLDEPGEDERH